MPQVGVDASWGTVENLEILLSSFFVQGGYGRPQWCPVVAPNNPERGTPCKKSASPGTLYDMEPGRAKKSMSELRRGTVVFCVLALLDERERYAVELVSDLADTEALAASQGTIYPLLSRLRDDGLVATTWQESPSGPPRRYYRLTDQGQRSLETFREEWVHFREAVDQLLRKGQA